VEKLWQHARSKVTGEVRGSQGSNFKRKACHNQDDQWVAGLERTGKSLGFHSSVPYRPIPGLVALFARRAPRTENPRAPRTRSCTSTGFSFAEVVRTSMDRGSFNGNNIRGGNGRRFASAQPFSDWANGVGN
jgi:hypothetical protein